MTPMIEIQNLSKLYNKHKPLAVDGLNLSVEAGEIFGFVGPNGAGKTSTIRIMATLLKASGGDVQVGGHSVRKEPDQVRRLIGYMPDFFGVYSNMRVWEYLDFFAACYKIPPASRPGLIADLLELVELAHRREDMVDLLSRGMKQRLCLARTLIHDPQVLILDEPASGLDPRARVEIRELMVHLSKMGKTVFFSTHILADVEEICTRVGIIEAGKMVAIGDLAMLQQQLMPRRKIEISVLASGFEAKGLLENLPGVSGLQLLPAQNGGPDRLELEFTGEDAQVSQMLAELVRANIPVIHFNADQRDLEAVFMKATRGLVT